MAQSARSTEYFDRNVESQENPGTIPPMYTQTASTTASSKKAGRLMGAVSIALRVATMFFSLIALGLMVSWKFFIITYLYENFEGTYKFSDFAASKAVVAVNAIVAFYALVQAIHTGFILALGKIYPQPVAALAIVTYIFDLMLAFMLIAATAAGTAVIAIFATIPKAEAAVSLSFVAFLFLAASSVLSAHRVFQPWT